jgi:hypothetical protein
MFLIRQNKQNIDNVDLRHAIQEPHGSNLFALRIGCFPKDQLYKVDKVILCEVISPDYLMEVNTKTCKC